MKNKNLNGKKAVALQTLALLILAVVSFTIALTFFMKSGIFSSMETFTCPTLTSFGSVTKGMVYQKANQFHVDFDTATQDAFGRSLEVVGDFAESVKNVPLVSCTNPQLNKKYEKPCGSDSAYDKDVFLRDVSKLTLDCWKMYGKGEYDPLTDMTPPNPRTCFTITFSLNDKTNFNEINDYLMTNYTKQVTAASLGPRLIENTYNQDLYKYSSFKKGVLFIKYGDLNLDPNSDDENSWASADCSVVDVSSLNTGSGYSDFLDSIKFDYIFWCLAEEASYDENCGPFVWDGN